VIGRSSEVSVHLDEDSISRRHALLQVHGDHLTITDLGSLNGTKVRDRLLTAQQTVVVSAGETFELGTVMVVLQRRRKAERARRRIYDHSYFESRVDEEIARRISARRRSDEATVRAFMADLTLCRIHVDVVVPLADGVLAEALEAALPPAVIAAEYAPGELELMFMDQPWSDVELACEQLRQQLGRDEATVRIGFALFPRDGRTASQLLAVANAGVSSSEPEPTTAEVHLVQHRAPAAETPSPMAQLQRLVERVADSDISIVIHGETGVGKEVMAKEIHRLSPRAGKPFVGLNCAALTETLLESELFGHERGAFSGAVNTKPGLFEVAEKGTVFLDEIGEMSSSIQAKLLRVLEERQVLRVGGLSPRSIDVRFLAASHKDLEGEVAAGRFRQDLYFRLNGITVEIPPLRERVSEIEGLCTGFIVDAARRNRRPEVPTVSREALSLLKHYAWPGNIRELRNIVERAVLLCTDGRITAEHLPAERLQRHRVTAPPAPAPARTTAPPPAWRHVGDDDDDGPHTRPAVRAAVRPDDAFAGPRPGENLKEAVTDLERQRIVDALRSCGGNQTKAAELLGISRRTLVNRLNQFELPRPRK
jgi:DNA-binding NtrC family response regulator